MVLGVVRGLGYLGLHEDDVLRDLPVRIWPFSNIGQSNIIMVVRLRMIVAESNVAISNGAAAFGVCVPCVCRAQVCLLSCDLGTRTTVERP